MDDAGSLSMLRRGSPASSGLSAAIPQPDSAQGATRGAQGAFPSCSDGDHLPQNVQGALCYVSAEWAKPPSVMQRRLAAAITRLRAHPLDASVGYERGPAASGGAEASFDRGGRMEVSMFSVPRDLVSWEAEGAVLDDWETSAL